MKSLKELHKLDDKRFVAPRQGSQYSSEYDLDSAMLIDLNQRDIAPLRVETLNLAVAGSKWVNTSGRGFVPYFYLTGSANKTQVPSGAISVYVNESNSSNPNVNYPAKHNQGFRGSFGQVFLVWAAQAGVSVDFIFLKSRKTPWMTTAAALGGSSGGGITGTVAAKSANFTTDTNNFFPTDATAGNITAALAASGNVGQQVSINKIDGTVNTVTVTGGLTGNVVLNFQGDSITYYWSGSAWVPIG